MAFQPFAQIVRVVEQIQTAARVALEPVQRIREAFAAISPEQEKPVFRLFTKLGLTGLESHLTRSELLYVLRLSREKGNKAVLAYIFRKFKRNKYALLNRMVRGWWCVPYMNRRKKTIRAAFRR